MTYYKIRNLHIIVLALVISGCSNTPNCKTFGYATNKCSAPLGYEYTKTDSPEECRARVGTPMTDLEVQIWKEGQKWKLQRYNPGSVFTF